MKTRDIDYHLLTSVDDIMWLLNIRGNDVKYSPLLSSFAILAMIRYSFLDEESKFPSGWQLNLTLAASSFCHMRRPEQSFLPSRLTRRSSISPASTSASLYTAIPAGMKIIEDFSIPARMKAVKNKTETENIWGRP